MISVQYSGLQPQYNTPGKLVCNNGGALFMNNASISSETVCTETANWTFPENADCYTGTCTILKINAFDI